MHEIIVVGYPKSGNTWLSRLIGDLMDYPIVGFEDAVPIAAEGADRAGDGIVRQLHLMPGNSKYPHFITGPHTVNTAYYGDENIVHIVRDPRDVAVSIDAYWELGDLARTLESVMGKGDTPLWGTGWREFVESWRASKLPHFTAFYNDLCSDAAATLKQITTSFGLTPANSIEEVVRRQSFDVRRAALEENGNNLPYGAGIQLKNLRLGKSGDWVNHFDEEHKRIAHRLFGDYLMLYGYESSPLWWMGDGAEKDEDSLIAMLDLLIGKLTDTGEEFCRTLYRLAEDVRGVIVELGAGVGRTAITLGWHGQQVWSVDNYTDNVDWAGNVYGALAHDQYHRNVSAAQVPTAMVNMDAVKAAGRFSVIPIGLWVWDISAPDRLLGDWLAWREQVKGRAVIRDTFDKRLGSPEVVAYEATRGEFEIERDDPGILVLRRTP